MSTASSRTCRFKPSQILCLAHEQSALYVELIQVVEERHHLWVRPLVLLDALTDRDPTVPQSSPMPQQLDADSLPSQWRTHQPLTGEPPLDTLADTALFPDALIQRAFQDSSHIHDVRQCSDLLWPTCLFRAALDVEVMPLMTYLSRCKDTSESDRAIAHQTMQRFIRLVWQANTTEFYVP